LKESRPVTRSKVIENWKGKANKLKNELHAMYMACRDPRVPWYAKAFIFLVVAYALSPIDLIPDFIPVVGYLDDLLLIPLGITIALKMIPKEVMEDAKGAQRDEYSLAPLGAIITVVIWLLIIIVIVKFRSHGGMSL
jgi:uncharacterized membrane protein YkvA (DUF1232 family)